MHSTKKLTSREIYQFHFDSSPNPRMQREDEKNDFLIQRLKIGDETASTSEKTSIGRGARLLLRVERFLRHSSSFSARRNPLFRSSELRGRYEIGSSQPSARVSRASQPSARVEPNNWIPKIELRTCQCHLRYFTIFNLLLKSFARGKHLIYRERERERPENSL